MNNDKNCGNCVRMRKTDGYCPMHGYVNALSVRPCFCGEDDTPPAVQPRRYRTKIVYEAIEGKPASIPVGMKYCSKCNRTMPLDAFSLDRSRSDGHNNYCRSCQRRKQSDYRKKIGRKLI